MIKNIIKMFVVLILIGPIFSYAITTEDTSTLAGLISQLLQLQKQIVDMGGAQVPIPDTITSAPSSLIAASDTCIFMRTLQRGNRGKDVSCLQRFLVSQKLLLEDNVTGYYGVFTEQAVKKFQKVSNLEQVGWAGRLTRERINKIQRESLQKVSSVSEGVNLPTIPLNNPSSEVSSSILGGGARSTIASSDGTALTVRVTDYEGVDPTGSQDSSSGIRAAIGVGGRKVLFPCGTYVINQSIPLPSHTEVAGVGRECVIIKALPTIALNPLWPQYMPGVSNRSIMTNSDFTNGNTFISIHDITFDASSVSMHLISFVRSSNIVVDSVRLYGGDGYPSNDGISFVGSDHYSITNSECSNMHNACYDQWDGSHDFTIKNNTIDGKRVMIHGVLVNGISSENKSFSARSNMSYAGVIEGNVIKNIAATGIGVYGSCSTLVPTVCGEVRDITIRNNTIDTVSDIKTGLSYFGILVDGKNIVVSNNIIKNTYQSGIWVGRANTVTDGIVVSENRITDSNMGYASSTKPTRTDAITVTNNAANITLKNNIVVGSSHRYAIGITSGVSGVSICSSSMDKGYAGVISDAGMGTVYPCEKKISTIGYSNKVSIGDGIAYGWAFDRSMPDVSIPVQLYVDGTPTNGGVLVGRTVADTVFKQVNWDYSISGDHGFYFRIPDLLRDGKTHALHIYPVAIDGSIGDAITPPEGISFTINQNTAIGSAPITDTSCLDPNSRCPSVGNNYLSPNYPTTSGWSDGHNYFTEWKCTSPVGYNYIARLNILPLGTHGPNVQKDSLDASIGFDMANGSPLIYFVTASNDFFAKWSLKKALYNKATNSWEIYSVLDNPTVKGGVSSQNGRSGYYVVNDYGQPGWGPVSPTPGFQNKIPGVSHVSSSKQFPSYPLMGSGPLGITAITSTIWPSTSSGGPEGRTCIHMNPKLLDYDSNGVPHTLIANLWQNTTNEACKLPVGAPVRQLPSPGNYVYRYKGPELGWQLDLDFGRVTDSLHDDPSNSLKQTPKLAAGTEHGLLVANWDGTIEYLDIDKPKTSNATTLLDCSAGGIHFGEVAGRKESLFFLGVKPDIATERARYNLSDSVLPGDIYYAFTK